MTSTLDRFLSPRSVAVVGASERRMMSNAAVNQLLSADIDLHLVNPTVSEAYGRPTSPSLTALRGPVDAVLSLVGAEAAVGVVEEAARLACGGVVVVASGFAEAGPSGRRLQHRLRQASGKLPVLGPNCTGFVNVTTGAALFTGMAVPVTAGGISVVSQSGYLTRAAMVAAHERGLGIRLALSTGNEAVTGLADLVDFLAADADTRVICLVLEAVRDRRRFFAAVRHAHSAGKAVIALKLGSSERGREITRSHTGTIATEAWVYDVGLRQAGVVPAVDLEDLLDRALFLEQVPPSRWRPVHNVVVIASSGGVAALASDTVHEAGVRLPPLDDLLAEVRERIPGAPCANPLDLTGFAIQPAGLVEDLVEVFTGSDEVDAVVVGWWLGDDDENRANVLLEPLQSVASRTDVLHVMTTVEASRIGSWVHARGREVAFGRGLRGTMRGLGALTAHCLHSGGSPAAAARRRGAALPAPRPVASAVGPIVRFDDAMAMLADHGVPVAPWLVTDDARSERLGRLGDDLVVKLADVPHRTELRVVRMGVTAKDAIAVTDDLRRVAVEKGLPATIAVQTHVGGAGEAFIGLRTRTDLGAVIVVGLGGVFVELTRRVVGRLLPVNRADIDEMIAELPMFADGVRGAAPWDQESFARAVLGVAELGRRSATWLESIDVNPVICGPVGCVAVDALLVMRRRRGMGGKRHGHP